MVLRTLAVVEVAAVALAVEEEVVEVEEEVVAITADLLPEVMVILVGAVVITTAVGDIVGEVVVVAVVVMEGVRKTVERGEALMEITKEETIAVMVKFLRPVRFHMEAQLGATPLRMPMVGAPVTVQSQCRRSLATVVPVHILRHMVPPLQILMLVTVLEVEEARQLLDTTVDLPLDQLPDLMLVVAAHHMAVVGVVAVADMVLLPLSLQQRSSSVMRTAMKPVTIHEFIFQICHQMSPLMS